MTVLVVDDDAFVSASLETILEANAIKVAAIGSSGEEAIALYKQCVPDILLMDIRMGGITGIDAAKEIIEAYPEAKVLFLTTFLDDEYIVQALKIGTKGYILKQDFEGIVTALYVVHDGKSVFGDQIIEKLPELMKQREQFDYYAKDIHEKELEIIKLVAEGMSNKEIAGELYLSEGTVRNYLSLILEKLELRDRTQLAIFYYQHK